MRVAPRSYRRVHSVGKLSSPDGRLMASCPRCDAKPREKCVKMTGTPYPVELKHPHSERN